MFKVTPILAPPGTLSAAKYKRAIDQARGIAETAGLQEARAVSRKWKHKPIWKIERKGDESHIVTDDEVFGYQDRGTGVAVGKGKYEIRPRRKRALYWKGARHPVKRVRHPGVKAQHFTATIAAAMQKQYQRIMQDEINRVIP